MKIQNTQSDDGDQEAVKNKYQRVNIRFPKTSQKYSDYYEPMLATLVDKAFDGNEWIFEIKWDGYRAVAEWQDKKLRLYSRNGLSFAEKFKIIAEAVQTISHDAVLDGEIVVLDEKGKPNFQKLQHYEENPELPIVYYVFDLLFLDKKDIRYLPLLQRKELLKSLFEKNKNDSIQYCEHITERGIDMFEAAKKNNLEGIIAKKSDSEYHCGARSKEWLKIKHQNAREGIIVGYTEPRNSRKYFGALVLGQYAGNELIYMGHTGTGFDQKGLKELWEKMQPLITNRFPFKQKVKVNMPVTWIRPKLVCQLSFTEQTEEGLLRHPVYLGLRNDKKLNEVKKENEEPKKIEIINDETKKESESEVLIGKKKVIISNSSKIYWPDEGFTKGDMIEYYKKIAPYILPYLKDRPLSLKRNPNGIDGESFFHKDAGERAPSWVKKINIHSASNDKIIHYIMANDAPSLVYAANLGCIEMNPWFSTSKKIDNPTYMVIDIDPSEKNTFDEVIETALAVKSVLDKAGAPCYCKTSGARGMHVYVPMGNKYSFDQVKNFAHLVATLTCEQMMEITTLERSLSKRSKNKIYVDYLQNRRGQTLACAYSLRPKAGAPVSTPLEWKEVKKGLHPLQFNIQNIHKRLEIIGDLFSAILTKGIDLKKCISNLEK